MVHIDIGGEGAGGGDRKRVNTVIRRERAARGTAIDFASVFEHRAVACIEENYVTTGTVDSKGEHLCIWVTCNRPLVVRDIENNIRASPVRPFPNLEVL